MSCNRDAMIDDLCGDPDVIEAARVDAWFSDGHKPDWFGRHNGVPNGWPAGVNPESHTKDHVQRCLPKDDSDTPSPAGDEPDGLIQQFREAINADQR